MLVPQFKLSQDDKYIVITIRVPYVKISKAEFYIDTNSFKFYLKPYLLTLTFEEQLKLVQEPESAVYYQQKHLLEVKVLKNKQKEHFKNLDLITNLLSIKKKDKSKKLHKVLIQTCCNQSSLQIQQNHIIKEYSYGFNNNYENVFQNLEEQVYELCQFNPETVKVSERHTLMNQIIESNFDEGSYLFDLYQNNEQIQCIMKLDLNNKLQNMKLENEPKIEQLNKIKNKQILISKQSIKPSLIQLVNIVFCYLYEFKCMSNQFGVQSACTINKLSSVFSCNIVYQDNGLKQTIVDAYKRCLTHALYKNYQLCQYVRKELNSKFVKNEILQILLDLRRLFQTSQPRYLLNRIYIDDYCIFIQKISNSQIESIQSDLIKIEIKKADVGLDLQEIEQYDENQK